MRKILLFCTLVLALFASFGCQKKGDNINNSIVRKGLLTVGVDEGFAPMSFRDKDNILVGFDIDLAKEVAKRLGLKFEPVLIDWESKHSVLNSNIVDCVVSGFSENFARSASMNLTKPYLSSNTVFIVNTTSDYKTTADLKGKHIGVQVGSTAVDSLKKSSIANHVNVIEYELNTYTLNDLRIGRIAGAVMDDVAAKYIIKNEGANIKILDEALETEYYTVAIKKGNDELSIFVEKTLDDIKADGTLRKLSIKWFSEDNTLN